MTTERTENPSKSPIVRQNLAHRMLVIRATFPHLKISQERIARKIRKDQSSVSLAMRKPERLPAVAQAIEKYFDTLESSHTKDTTPAQTAHA